MKAGTWLLLFGLLAGAPLARAADDPAAAPVRLVDAYKKEYAFLEAEKQALKKRLQALGASSDQKLGQARLDIRELQRRVLDVRGRADQLERDLEEAERQAVSVEEDADKLDEALSRAAESLSREGFPVGPRPAETQAQAAWLRSVFAQAVAAMRAGGGLRREAGAFFLVDGTRVEGSLIHLGRVATFGVAPQAAGLLAPAGAGRLKLWPGEGRDTAQSLAEGRTARSLTLFLYESLEKAVEPKPEKTAREVIASGGIIGWIIVGLGGLALLMILARVLILLRAGFGARRLVALVTAAVGAGKPDAARAVCARSGCAAARVLETTVAHLDRDRQQLEDLVSESILERQPGIERFGSSITIFAAVAPLLGLLGTVTGIISTFDVITEFGTGDPKLLSGGISEALVTTELGLMVAIPALLLGTLLSGRAQSILANLERAALAVVNAACPLPPEETGETASPEAVDPVAKQVAVDEPAAADPSADKASAVGGVA